MKLYVLLILSFILNIDNVKGQINIDTLFSGVKTDSLSFGIYYRVRFFNEDGTLQNVQDILYLSDTTLTNRLENYEKDSLLSIFINYMKSDETTYDWAMNLVLYYIYQVNPIPMYYYFYDYYPFKIKEWRKNKKNENILFWEEMLMQKTHRK